MMLLLARFTCSPMIRSRTPSPRLEDNYLMLLISEQGMHDRFCNQFCNFYLCGGHEEAVEIVTDICIVN